MRLKPALLAFLRSILNLMIIRRQPPRCPHSSDMLPTKRKRTLARASLAVALTVSAGICLRRCVPISSEDAGEAASESASAAWVGIRPDVRTQLFPARSAGQRDARTHRHLAEDASGEDFAAPKLKFKSKGIPDSIRNVGMIASMAGVVAFSWWFTGKWWKLPMFFAMPSMVYRLWTTRGDTTKLAEVSASVDMKYVASTEEEQRQLHSFMCSQCGYTLFPARGREGAFFPDKFQCPMCKAPKSAFFDMSDADEDLTPGPDADSKPAAEPASSTPSS
eukprot:TRINITY_DN83683_c0_g1_i1.p1 TRINITY_DN83683_c0_g1~~TRINITY_DN83683_c0_g1_i1.p1  ORF type:complete len:277 (+),score=55.00 TRINITY_DN83683_c0_g1_i1:44-874(+)